MVRSDSHAAAVAHGRLCGLVFILNSPENGIHKSRGFGVGQFLPSTTERRHTKEQNLRQGAQWQAAQWQATQ